MYLNQSRAFVVQKGDTKCGLFADQIVDGWVVYEFKRLHKATKKDIIFYLG